MPASSASQPSLVAEMLELLDLTPGLRVLEVGAGTGYNAALMAELVGDQHLVATLDVLQDVVEQTRRLLARASYPRIAVLWRDGVQGAAERAPFDRIVATVGCSDLSPRWVEQLAEGGVLLVPLEHAGGHPLFLLHKKHGRLQGRVASWAGFMPIRGLLHLDGLWPLGVVQPDPGEPIHQRDPWPGFAAAGPLPGRSCSADETDFGFYLSLGGPAGLLGAWWGRVERWPERLGDRRSRRHPLVEGCRPGAAAGSSARAVADVRPTRVRRLPGGVRPDRGGPYSPA